MKHTALLHLYSSLSSFDFADTPTYLDKNSALKSTYTVNVYKNRIALRYLLCTTGFEKHCILQVLSMYL